MQSSIECEETLTLIFDISFKLKFSYHKSSIKDLVVNRAENSPVSLLYNHLERSLQTKNKREVYSLLPIAICLPTSFNHELIPPTHQTVCTRLPLVSEDIWRYLIEKYPYDEVKIVVKKRLSVDLLPRCGPFMSRRELKCLDVPYYFPQELKRKNLIDLSNRVLHEDYYIKKELRRGVWMHLLGVFHPGLKTHDERETYIDNLRRIYETLKGKLGGDPNEWSSQIIHLRESIQRDAIRTDPTETFLAGTTGNPLDDNMEKLIEIIMIYTLEHDEIKYTQGMTDLLSPILYVMEREDDAYICFSAMFERIKENFSEWCEGTLNKLERLRHLCEVLDPELYTHLSQNQLEDPFVLFFGMVLIECRREFEFQDGLHLLEVLWSAAVHRDVPSLVSNAHWASYMSSVSKDVILQVFGEVQVPYSTEPLEGTLSDIVLINSRSSSRHSESCARQIPRPGSANMRSGNQYRSSESNDSTPLSSHHLPSQNTLPSQHSSPSVRERSSSLPESGFVIVNTSDVPRSLNETKSEGNLHKVSEEEESRDRVSELDSNNLQRRINTLPSTNEMSDLSSLSSATSNGVSLLASLNSYEGDYSPLVSKRSQNNTDNTSCSPPHTSTTHTGSQDYSTHTGSQDHSTGSDEENEFFHVSMKVSETQNVLDSESSLPTSPKTVTGDDRSMPSNSTLRPLPHSRGTTPPDNQNDIPSSAFRKSHTLPRNKQHLTPEVVRKDTSTLPRLKDPSSLPPTSFLRQLTYRHPITSPYVSSIRALDPFQLDVDNVDPFSPHSSPSPSRLSPLPPFFETMEKITNEPLSMEASLEVSHVLSELASAEQTRPNVNRESSLQIRVGDAFSLFICLAILVTNRHKIMEEQMDFVAISVLLNSQAGKQKLPLILKVARQLHKVYRSYQQVYFESIKKPYSIFEVWLDDLSVVTMTTPGTTPMTTPSSIRRASCMINTEELLTERSVN